MKGSCILLFLCCRGENGRHAGFRSQCPLKTWGFESPRQQFLKTLERWSSGRRHLIRNQARGNSSGVRIPLFPFSFNRQDLSFSKFNGNKNEVFEYTRRHVRIWISKYKRNSCHFCRMNLQDLGRVFGLFLLFGYIYVRKTALRPGGLSCRH